jgi:hypothetical protein
MTCGRHRSLHELVAVLLYHGEVSPGCHDVEVPSNQLPLSLASPNTVMLNSPSMESLL